MLYYRMACPAAVPSCHGGVVNGNPWPGKPKSGAGLGIGFGTKTISGATTFSSGQASGYGNKQRNAASDQEARAT